MPGTPPRPGRRRPRADRSPPHGMATTRDELMNEPLLRSRPFTLPSPLRVDAPRLVLCLPPPASTPCRPRARHRRARLHRLARRRGAARRGPARPDPRPRAGTRSRIASPTAPSSSRADLRDADAVARCVRDVTAVSHQAVDGGPGRRLRRRDALRRAQRSRRPPCCLRALAAARFRGRLVLASSMVVYGEGALPLPRSTGRCRAPPRDAHDLDAGRWEPRLPGLRRGARPRGGDRGRADRSAQRLRGDEAPPGAPRSRLRPGARGAGRAPALPQRVRAADAARHAVRRRRQHLPQRAGGGPRPAGVRGRRSAPRLRPRRATSPTPTSARSPTTRPPGAYNVASGEPAHDRGDGGGAAGALRARPRRRSSPAASGWATSATSSRRPPAPRPSSASRRGSPFDAGMRGVRPRAATRVRAARPTTAT